MLYEQYKKKIMLSIVKNIIHLKVGGNFIDTCIASCDRLNHRTYGNIQLIQMDDLGPRSSIQFYFRLRATDLELEIEIVKLLFIMSICLS